MIQLSNLQLFVMIFSSVVANGILAIPQVAAGIGGPGGWIVVLVYGLFVTFTVTILVKLMERFPNSNYISVIEQITGRVGSYIIGLLLIIYATLFSAMVVRSMANIATTIMFQQTPNAVLISVMIFVCIYVVYHGIEVLARVNVILFTLKIIATIAIIFMALPDARLANLQPLWHRGNEPWVTGTLTIAASYHGAIIVAFIYKSVNNKKQALFTAVGSMAIVTIVYGVFTMVTIATFGSNETTRMIWPAISLIREIPIPVEPVLTAIWLTNSFSVASAFLFVAAYGMKCLFKLVDYRTILLPLSIIVVTIASTPTNQGAGFDFFNNMGFTGIFLEWLLPMVLLILAVVFKKKEQSNP